MLKQLPDTERAVRKMRFFDGMTRSRIAARLGVSRMQVSRVLAKTLEDLRKSSARRTTGSVRAEAEGAGELDDNDSPTSRPHPLVIAVTTAARGGLLWLAAAFVLTRLGRSRAARRGLFAGAAGMAAAHMLAPLVGRRRPRADDLPARQALPERPTSAAFPSKHATTAAAFATAVTLEAPAEGLWVTPLAAVVCYGRLRTRAHWPSDVYAGVALGVAIAVVTRRYGRDPKDVIGFERLLGRRRRRCVERLLSRSDEGRKIHV